MTTVPVTSPKSDHRAVWWALGFTLPVLIALGALAVGVFLMIATAYGVGTVLFPGSDLAAPSGTEFRIALAASSLVAVLGSVGLALLRRYEPVAGWHPALVGLLAALLAGLVAGCVLLLSLGINPLSLLG